MAKLLSVCSYVGGLSLLYVESWRVGLGVFLVVAGLEYFREQVQPDSSA